MVKQQLKEMSAQCDENMEQLHSTQKQVAAKDLEIEKLAEEVCKCVMYISKYALGDTIRLLTAYVHVCTMMATDNSIHSPNYIFINRLCCPAFYVLTHFQINI